MVLDPDNVTTLVNCTVSSGYTAPGNGCNLPALPSTGTYTVRVTTGTGYAATFSLALSSDASAVLTPNAAPTLFSTTRVGQNARYTFNATAGQNASVVWSGSTFAGTWSTLSVLKPDGSTLSSALFDNSFYPTRSLALANLPATGVYTVFVDPFRASTGQVSVKAQTDLLGTLSTDGTSVNVSLAPWQNADYSFAGTQGQDLVLMISNVVTAPANQSVAISLIAPDGFTTLFSCNPLTLVGPCALPPLASTGTYTIHVQTSGNYTTGLTLWLQ